MVRIITNDDLCCEITLNPSSYNLIKLSCNEINTNLSPSITAIDLSSRTKKGDLLHSIIGAHEIDENAHKTLFRQKADISTLSNVATSGDYNDLKNKPFLPEINNGTLTITQDGTTKGIFSANQNENTTIEISTNLNSKANTDLSNVPSSKGILTESYVNGSSWYRVYSDGWCEQGGYITSNSNETKTITFMKSFNNTNYGVSLTQKWNSVNYNANANVQTTSTVSMTITGQESGVYWLACGYIR